MGMAPKSFLMCTDKANYCTVVNIRYHQSAARGSYEASKALTALQRDSHHSGLKHYWSHAITVPPSKSWHPSQHRE